MKPYKNIVIILVTGIIKAAVLFKWYMPYYSTFSIPT